MFEYQECTERSIRIHLNKLTEMVNNTIEQNIKYIKELQDVFYKIKYTTDENSSYVEELVSDVIDDISEMLVSSYDLQCQIADVDSKMGALRNILDKYIR